MPRIAALLRRYSTTLFLLAIALLGALAASQSVRLHYLEQRHQAMFSDFGKARSELNTRAAELAAELARCRQQR